MADWKDILQNDEPPMSEEDLLRHVDARVSNNPAGGQDLFLEDDFEADAVQGLTALESRQKIQDDVIVLKKQLHKHLRSKKNKKLRPGITGMQWAILAAIILLLTCILGYTVIKWLNG